jgi:beta-glucosidase
VVRAPNADLGRDPRWGAPRNASAKTPFFNGTMVVAMVRGLQGDDPKYWLTASLMKHFLANSNENGRGDRLPISMSGCCANITRFLSAWA